MTRIPVTPGPILANRMHPPRCRRRGKTGLHMVPCPAPSRCKQVVYACDLHGQCTLGKSATDIKSCATCEDREEPAIEPEPAGPVLARPGRTCLVTLNIGGVLTDHARRSHETAAARWKCDYEALESRRLPADADPRWEKVTLDEWASRIGYARVAYVDADVLIRSDAPSLFTVTPPDTIGVVANDQFPGAHWRARLQNAAWRNLATWALRLNAEVPPTHLMPNTGVIVWSVGQHADLWHCWHKAGEDAGWQRVGGWTDQAAFAVLLHAGVAPSAVTWLPPQFNLLAFRPDMIPTDGRAPAYLTHFPGAQAKTRLTRCQWDLRPAPAPSPHPPQTDASMWVTGELLGSGVDVERELGKRVVITLPQRQDRYDQFYASWDSDGKRDDPSPFYAVDGRFCPAPSWWLHSPGQWGALCSHRRVIEMALDCQWNRLTILEDDALPVTEFEEQLRNWLQYVPKDWELLFLGGQTLRRSARRLSEHLVWPGYTILTHAYCLRGRGLTLAYKALHEQTGERGEVDHRIAALSASGAVRAYAPPHWLVHQREGYSDISECKRPLRGTGGPLTMGRTGEEVTHGA